VALLSVVVISAHATTITVVTPNDSGNDPLRRALADANPRPGAASRARPTPHPRPAPGPLARRVSCPQYTITAGTDTIVPGSTDTGNHCVWCDTVISLPFPFVLYDQTFTAVNVTSSGRLDFLCINEPAGYTETCLPAPPNNCPYDYTIFPLWAEWSTDERQNQPTNI
jgi:hypothetical protein